METSENSDLDRLRHLLRPSRRDAAFSLVEVALALGIMAFALVSIFSLLPLGLTSFRQTMVTATGSQIAQQIFDEVQQSDFDTLVHDSSGGTGTLFTRPVRYFDERGTEVATAQAGAIYWVNTRILASTAMPGPTAGYNNVDVATVTVQVANNPANRSIDFIGGDSQLWKPSSSIAVVTSSTYVARSSSNPGTLNSGTP